MPSYHRNVHYDEVFFTHSGEFTLSGKPGARPMGVMTLNPAGLQHGPQPGVEEASRANWRQDARLTFTAINVDTEQPLELTEVARAVEIPEYYTTGCAPRPQHIEDGPACFEMAHGVHHAPRPSNAAGRAGRYACPGWILHVH